MNIVKKNHRVFFDDKEEAFSVNGYHFSPWFEEVFYIYSEKDNMLLTVNFREFLNINKIEKQVEKLDRSIISNSSGTLLYLSDGKVHIESLIDMYSQKIITLFNGEKVRHERGPICMLNDCRYDVLFYFDNIIYHLVINLNIDYNINCRLYIVNPDLFINEIIIDKLLNRFKAP